MTRKKHLWIILALIGALFLTACASELETVAQPGKPNPVKKKDSNEEEVDLTPVEGGQVTIPLTSFSSLNPLLIDNSSYYHFSKLIFEGLFDFDENLDMEPKLAESYTISENGRLVSIKLRDQVKWHDGTDFTAADVAFTIDTIKQGGNKASYSQIIRNTLGPLENFNIWRALSTRIVDEKNIDIIFQKAYSNKLEALSFPIIPKHLHLKKNGRPDYKSALATSNYQAIGTGPYKLEEYKNKKTIQLKRNENYWAGPAYIESIQGKVFSDEELILNAFETGQVSFSQAQGLDWEKYRKSPKTEIIEYTGPDFLFLGFNFKNKDLAGEAGRDIRRAIAYGLDRQEIIKDIYNYHGVAMDLPIHPDSYLLADEAHAYGYNPEKSRKILEEAGYSLNQAGIYEDERRRPLSFRLAGPKKDPIKEKVLEEIKNKLEEIGIEVIVDKEARPGDFDLVLGEWTTSVVTDLSPMFHSSMIRRGSNIINYKNKDLDWVLGESLYLKDKEGKLQAYKEIQSIIIEDLPYIGLVFKNKALIIDAKIKDGPKPTHFNNYRGLEKAFIPQSLQ